MERSGIERAQRTRQTPYGISRALRNRQTHRVPAGASAGPRKPATQIIRPQTSKAGKQGSRMDTKNYTQVLIDGKVYTLGGSEDESYLQKAASYVNEKNSAMRKVPGFTKQSADYQMVMTELNIADDYFKAVEWGEGMERQKNDMEKETYSLKHELVSTQMKLEAVLKDLEERQREMDRLNRRTAQLEGELKEARENLQNLRNNPSADTENNAVVQAVEEIKETVEVEAGITLNASRTEYVSGSGARESSQPEAVPQTPEADASAQQPDTPAVQTAQKQPAPSLRVLNPASEAGRGMTAASAQAAATAAPPAAEPIAAAPAGGMTDEELARKALQAARKAGSHKGGRR
nr:cell division protein ZapA [Enterocloster bolteae]